MCFITTRLVRFGYFVNFPLLSCTSPFLLLLPLDLLQETGSLVEHGAELGAEDGLHLLPGDGAVQGGAQDGGRHPLHEPHLALHLPAGHHAADVLQLLGRVLPYLLQLVDVGPAVSPGVNLRDAGVAPPVDTVAIGGDLLHLVQLHVLLRHLGLHLRQVLQIVL